LTSGIVVGCGGWLFVSILFKLKVDVKVDVKVEMKVEMKGG